MSSDSILDIIAKMTAKTITSVHEFYRDTPAGSEKEKAGNDPHGDSAPFFTYGTPFSDIVQFTRDVEEFTRHIDTQTRKRGKRK